MRMESLIPFGLKGDQIVDVGSVKRGDACGCVCLSCSAPLTARQGRIKEWHFAHRSLDIHEDVRKECDYSLEYSIRQMIRQQLNSGMKIKVPELYEPLTAFSQDSYESANFGYRVTNKSLIAVSNVEIGVNYSGVLVDILGKVNGVPFVIYVTYEGRELPEELENPTSKQGGIIELDVYKVIDLFQNEKHGKYNEALARYISEGVEGKRWAYHPREERIRKVALEKRKEWVAEQKAKPGSRSSEHEHQFEDPDIEPSTSNDSFKPKEKNTKRS